MGVCAEVLTVDGVDVLAFASACATSSTVSRCWSSRYGQSAVRSDRLLNASMAACVSPPVPPPPGRISLFPVYIGGSSSPCGVALKPLERHVSGAFCVLLPLILPLAVKQQNESKSRTNKARLLGLSPLRSSAAMSRSPFENVAVLLRVFLWGNEGGGNAAEAKKTPPHRRDREESFSGVFIRSL